MDSAMRDMDRIRERDEGERQLGVWLLAAVAVAGLVLSMGMLMGHSKPTKGDPFAALEEAASRQVMEAESTSAAQGGAPAREPIDATQLVFPEALREQDARPEVELAMAAAEAELAHPDPVTAETEPARPINAVPPESAPVAKPSAPVPAAVAAAPSSSVEAARRTGQDPLVSAITPPAKSGPKAPAGMDGAYTLQVASYQSPEDAAEFAEELRARSHEAFVLQAEVAGRGTFHRVRIGPFKTMMEAEAYRSKFEQDEQMNTYIVQKHQ